MAMIEVWIKQANYKAEKTEIKLNVDIDDLKSKVKFPANGDKRENYSRFHNQKLSSGVLAPQNTTAGNRILPVEIDNDEDHVPKVARSVQNKVEQCGGNACPRCGKCIDWSYNRDMYRDYKRYQRDNKCIELLDKNRWDRRPNATCSYYSYSSHAASYYDPYHYDYYDYGYYVCGCEK